MNPQGQNYFYNNRFICLVHLFSHEYIVEFSRDYIMCKLQQIGCRNRCENPPASGKPDIKEIYKNVKQCMLLFCCCCFGK